MVVINTTFKLLLTFSTGGYLGYIQKVMESQELVPDIFLRITLIDGYAEFLKVHFLLHYNISYFQFLKPIFV